MKIKYIYSACLEIDCDGFKILTDPWFTDGIYDGAWYQYPKVDPFEYISKPDLIYISHIHPDHYDPIFLRKLIARYGDVKILIPDHNPNYLLFKSKSDGFSVSPTRHLRNDKVEIFIEENDSGSDSDIDSALIVKDLRTGNVLLNLNDCIFNQSHVDKLKEIIEDIVDNLDVLALGYTGAGPYPQTYIRLEDERDLLLEEGEKKKELFFRRYKQYAETFNAKYNLPFAGEYILGGKLHYLNDYRGVADAYEVKSFDKKAVVLLNGGEIDTVKHKVSNERAALHGKNDIKKRVGEIKDNVFDYEREICLPIEKIDFRRLLQSASLRAHKKSEIAKEYHFVFSILDEESQIKFRFDLNTEDATVKKIEMDAEVAYSEFSEIFIDYRYLYGLLTAIYHWNNATVGSQYLSRRYPLDGFSREVQRFLYFLTIA